MTDKDIIKVKYCTNCSFRIRCEKDSSFKDGNLIHRVGDETFETPICSFKVYEKIEEAVQKAWLKAKNTREKGETNGL